MKYIYIYETPASKALGLIKIGEAEDVAKRIEQQLNTAAAVTPDQLKYTLLYKVEAIRRNGEPFGDKVIHTGLESKGYPRHKIWDGNVLLKGSTEQFEIPLEKAVNLIEQYIAGKSFEEIDIDRFHSFPMRPSQEDAVSLAENYFTKPRGGVKEVLWNAKMRFGKTFAAYQLALRMGARKVLIVTYKPEVEAAWKEDLENHVDFLDFVFLRRDGLSRISEFISAGKRVVAFASYQDLHGENSDGSAIKDKHVQIFDSTWDLIIVDEFHYGAGSALAKKMSAELAETAEKRRIIEKEFDSEEDEEGGEIFESQEILEVTKTLKSTRKLYLSGTPFKAISNAQFEADAIFNWTYADEQRAKANWCQEYPEKCSQNPYKKLPQIDMYLYKVAEDLVAAGKAEDKDEFSLNHFFRTDKITGKFVNEAAVIKWLDIISGVSKTQQSLEDQIQDDERIIGAQYPYDHSGVVCKEIDHSLWYLNRIKSARALRDLLEAHPVFSNYKIIMAAGKEMRSGYEGVLQLEPTLNGHEKTITLSVGKLTTGVSVPKWKAVLFLRDTSSPENYFQTAFRAQTPCDYDDGSFKEKCYIFDFSPNRSLKLLTEYSEKLSPDSNRISSENKIAEFIRYLPVLMVDGNSMIELNAREVLTFDLNGVNSFGLGMRFIDRRNIRVNREIIDAVNERIEDRKRCDLIFSKIKSFRKFHGANDSEMKNEDANFDKLKVNGDKIKGLETKKRVAKSDEEKNDLDADQKLTEKEDASEREKLRNLLLNLCSRIPLYMYVTDATEENLDQVLVDDEDDLFRKATGITVDDFKFLREIGFIRADSMDGYILRFLQIENHNFENFDRMIKGTDNG